MNKSPLETALVAPNDWRGIAAVRQRGLPTDIFTSAPLQRNKELCATTVSAWPASRWPVVNVSAIGEYLDNQQQLETLLHRGFSE
jgi:hypothetical protein